MGNRFKGNVFAASARLLQGGSLATPADLLERAKARAKDVSIFDEHPPIFFPIEASNNSLDAYFTRMAPSSLRNYAQDAEEGRSFQDSHNHRALGLGASLTGRYEENGDVARVVADIFTLPGLPDLESFIFKMRAGIAQDVSIGFHSADHVCSVCGLDLWDWDCWHIPGLTYEKEERDSKGNVISSEEVLCFAWIENARLSEISIVYDGATPGCGILKAQQEVEAGRATPAIAARFAQAYRGLAMPGFQRLWPGAELSPDQVVAKGIAANPAAIIQGVKAMPQGNQQPASAGLAPSPETVPSPESRENAPQTTPAIQDDGLRNALTTALGDLKLTANDPTAGLRQLVTLAHDGQQYRADLIDTALAEGVRFIGEKFDQPTYRGILERASLAEVKRITEDWRAQADKLFPAGRKTNEEPAQTDEPTDRATSKDPIHMLPPSAFNG